MEIQIAFPNLCFSSIVLSQSGALEEEGFWELFCKNRKSINTFEQMSV